MTDYEKELSEQESLALITEMIGKARNHFHESGVSAILWGSVVSFCGMVSFAEHFWNFSVGFDVWLLALVAIIPQIIISIRENRHKEVRTHLEAALDAIWIVYSISIFGILFYINIVPAVSVQLLEKYEGIRIMQQNIASGSLEPVSLYTFSSCSLLLLIYAFPTMCTGLIQRFKPMILGAVLCYLFFIASFFTTTTYDLLFMGLAGIFNWLIPGIILRKRYLRAKHV